MRAAHQAHQLGQRLSAAMVSTASRRAVKALALGMGAWFAGCDWIVVRLRVHHGNHTAGGAGAYDPTVEQLGRMDRNARDAMVLRAD